MMSVTPEARGHVFYGLQHQHLISEFFRSLINLQSEFDVMKRNSAIIYWIMSMCCLY